ncbi:glycosyltransferase [Mucilaginibacter sp.]|jgi:glycosyltransferase involved in cell wall biosynthesis|uniref:glycosyltransferase n=1 Tax=Mucilaginibacter sp. TaxID=1882438 RepID=UPI003564381D
MTISVIYPSRGRPEIFKSTLKKWVDAARKPENIEWIVSIDQNDPCLSEYVSFYQNNDLHQFFFLEISRNRSAIDAINNGALRATNELFVVISDDFLPFENWDYALLGELQYKEDFIVKTVDGLQPTLMTLPIMDRKYYERCIYSGYNYIYFPEYDHMFCDQEMTAVGHMLGKVITLDLTFEHAHYTTGKFKKDAVSVRNDSTWAQGENLFNERLKTNFGIAEPVIPYSAIKWN